MSTQIYNAVKINTNSLPELIKIAQEIKEIEINNIREDLSKSIHFFLGDKTKEIEKIFVDREFLFSPGWDFFKEFVDAEKINPYANINKKNLKNFSINMKSAYPDISSYELSLLASVVEILTWERKLTFLPGDDGSSLMKWYTLADDTVDYILKKYPDYHYQNSTDGLELGETAPYLDKMMYEYVEKNQTSEPPYKEDLEEFKNATISFIENTDCNKPEFWQDAKGKLLAEIKPEKLSLAVSRAYEELSVEWYQSYNIDDYKTKKDLLIGFCSEVGREVFRLRSDEWDNALGNFNSYAESGISFDILSGFRNDPTRICAGTIISAVNKKKNNVKPVEEKKMKRPCVFPGLEDMYEDCIEKYFKED